ncbi:MAG: ImmA/IrrE family metallo-endopeptidase [Firmicutes bacterium]|nr:ImmA/IrrE family metallo-endopeptidase [Bacillota bacterium]
MTEDELIELVSKGLKSPLTREMLFSDEIQINHLKRIDRVFEKGLSYYVNPSEPIKSEGLSIFFRKSNFDTVLNLGTRKIVNHFEELKISLSSLAKLSDMKIGRKLPVYSINDNPADVAEKMRSLLNPQFKKNKKTFLIELINTFANQNIFVFEFVETWNKKEKANIDGMFLSPNVIVLKRQQKAFRREIFTLIHEFGHYLLNKEEVEEVNYYNLSSETEKWCNSFAFEFLADRFSSQLKQLSHATYINDYHHGIIKSISEQTHLSRLALYTHLLINKLISWVDYKKVENELEQEWIESYEREERIKEENKFKGMKMSGSTPKPIKSPLFISTLQSAFYDGVISEYDFCKKLNIKPERLNSYL